MSNDETLGPLVPGQRFPTSANRWNKVFDASRRVLQGTKPTPPIVSKGYQIWIANETGAPVLGTTVVGIGDCVHDTTKEGFYQSDLFYAADEETANDHAILLQTIEDGSVGPAVVVGVANAHVTGTPDAYAKIKAGGGLEYTDQASKFRVLDSHAENLAKLLILGCCDTAAGGTTGTDSCCCPDGGYRMDLSADVAASYPNATNSDQKIVVTEGEQTHFFGGTNYPIYFKLIAEISTMVLEDATIFKMRAKLTVTRPDPGNTQNLGLGFVYPTETFTDFIEVLDYPAGAAAFTSAAPPVGLSGNGDGHLVTLEYSDSGFTATGTDTVDLEYVLQINDVSQLGAQGRFGIFDPYSSGDQIDVNWFYYPCIDGSPDTDGDGEGDGPSGGGVGV